MHQYPFSILTHRIINLHPLPEMLVRVHKFEVNRMNLISIVGVPVCEDKRQREVIAMVNNWSAGISGGADVCL